MSSVKMYATKERREQDGIEYFHDIYDHVLSTIMSTKTGEKIFQVEVREALPEEETPYHGWKHFDGHIDMIFPSKPQLEVCFPYGTKAVTINGGGHMIKVVVTEINNKMNFCNDISPEERKIILELFSEINKRHTSIRSLLMNGYDSCNISALDTTSATVDIGQFKLKIANKSVRKNIQLITIDDKIECYYIGSEGRHWFFKNERKYHSVIRTIIYGKGKVNL